MDLEKIIGVIVLYKTSLEQSECFQNLLNSVNKSKFSLSLVVFNNSPNYWVYDHKYYEGLEITYLSDDKNSGVSKAYNSAFSYAKILKKQYILLLDQDTKLPAAFFDDFFDAERKYKNLGVELFCPMMMNDYGLISPAKFFFYTTKKLISIKTGVNVLKGLAIINSGLIISTRLFDLVGGYNEKIKLDFSDFDFLKRCLKFSNKIVVFSSICHHSLSSETAVNKIDAVHRFGYYIEGANFFHKTRFEGLFLTLWVFLRSIKLDYKYRTLDFTKKLLLHK